MALTKKEACKTKKVAGKTRKEGNRMNHNKTINCIFFIPAVIFIASIILFAEFTISRRTPPGTDNSFLNEYIPVLNCKIHEVRGISGYFYSRLANMPKTISIGHNKPDVRFNEYDVSIADISVAHEFLRQLSTAKQTTEPMIFSTPYAMLKISTAKEEIILIFRNGNSIFAGMDGELAMAEDAILLLDMGTMTFGPAAIDSKHALQQIPGFVNSQWKAWYMDYLLLLKRADRIYSMYSAHPPDKMNFNPDIFEGTRPEAVACLARHILEIGINTQPENMTYGAIMYAAFDHLAQLKSAEGRKLLLDLRAFTDAHTSEYIDQLISRDK